MQSKVAVGISLPKDIISEIDIERGDVSRSRYVLRLIEKTILETALSQKKKVKASVRSQPSTTLGATPDSTSGEETDD